MQMIATGSTSYWAWSYYLSHTIGLQVSKQAIHRRMNEAWLNTVKALAGECLAGQAGRQVKTALFSGFKNVWLQDSTAVQLPEVFFERFMGSVAKGNKYSVAKLNVVVHLLSGICPVMEWNSFTVTEQTLSSRIFSIAKPGDLVLRDLGYFVLKVFRQMNDKGIYFLSRWRYGVVLFNPQSGKQVQLAQLLKGKNYVDIDVICGVEERVDMRLVAVKLSDEQAVNRIRKAKKDGHRNVNHGKDYYVLLGYVIFLTNVSRQTWSCRQVAEAYRARWNVEILFKSWKSAFRIADFIPEARTNTQRVESWLYLLVLYISWFQTMVYYPMRFKHRAPLSIIRMAKWAFYNTCRWLQGLTSSMVKEIIYYCSYDTRRRLNAIQCLTPFLKPLS